MAIRSPQVRRFPVIALFALALLVPSLAFAASPGDFGDAPDSTNHFGVAMQAYPGFAITGRYPTVFDAATGLPQGPRHILPTAQFWLGLGVSTEDEADNGADPDGVNNIRPPANTANLDRFDDGPIWANGLALPDCGTAQFKYTVTSAAAAFVPTGYVNVWFDYNRDGDWADRFTCTTPSGGVIGVQEWAVRNQAIPIVAGSSTVFATPIFNSGRFGSPRDIWARITVADAVTPTSPSDGSGSAAGYRYGETEDYFLKLCPTCPSPLYFP